MTRLSSFLLTLLAVLLMIFVLRHRSAPNNTGTQSQTASEIAAELPTTLPANAPKPDPSLTPTQVVKIQLDNLQQNDTLGHDRGIAICYSFASPDNQQITGPLPRFVYMLKSGFPAMLHFKTADYGPVQIKGDRAQQAVALTMEDKSKLLYIWLLAKQKDGPYKDCWMTVGVMPMNPPPKEEDDTKHFAL